MMMMNIGMNRNGSYVISDEIDWEEEEEIHHRTVDVCGRTARRIYWLPQSEVNSILTVVNDDDLRLHVLFYVMIDGETDRCWYDYHWPVDDYDDKYSDEYTIQKTGILFVLSRSYLYSWTIKSRGTWIRIHLAWWWWLIELEHIDRLEGKIVVI